jgi:cobalt-zinc-cadmium efflux system protein
MAHGHHTHHGLEGSGRRLGWSIALNLVITVAEVVGGILSGSLALLSDALHNFSDTASLGISHAARRIARRDPNPQKTFGYRRAEIIGAFANLVTLVLIALFLMKEAVERLLDPQPVNGYVMITVAVIGLLANLLTAGLLRRDAQGSLNIRSAYLHVVLDAVSSVGVVVGGLLILWLDLYVVDPVLTFAISLYILYHSYEMLRQTTDILMESTPGHLNLDEIVDEVKSISYVRDAHHLHVWQLDEHHLALEAHVVIDQSDTAVMEHVKRSIKQRLAERFDISHSTLEFEFLPCDTGDGHCYEQDAAPHELATGLRTND